MRKKKQDRRWRNAGTSMVEVMIAFLIVMLLMAMFTKVVTTSISLLNRSKSTIEKTEAFDEKYYQTEERKTRKVVSEDISLVLDKEKTSTNNTKVRDLTIALPKGKIQKYDDAGGTKMSRYTVYVEPEEPEDGPEEETD